MKHPNKLIRLPQRVLVRLEMAGLAPFNFFTVAEAAELAEHRRSLPAEYAKRAGFDTPALWQNDRRSPGRAAIRA
jgi:hypothetical protein